MPFSPVSSKQHPAAQPPAVLSISTLNQQPLFQPPRPLRSISSFAALLQPPSPLYFLQPSAAEHSIHPSRRSPLHHYCAAHFNSATTKLNFFSHFSPPVNSVTNTLHPASIFSAQPLLSFPFQFAAAEQHLTTASLQPPSGFHSPPPTLDFDSPSTKLPSLLPQSSNSTNTPKSPLPLAALHLQPRRPSTPKTQTPAPLFCRPTPYHHLSSLPTSDSSISS